MAPTTRARIILGLDPGLARLGFAVVAAARDGLSSLSHGVIRTNSNDEHAARIDQIVTAVEEIARAYPINEAALEDLYFARNVSSALSVAQVRGALMLVLERAGIPIVTFSPNTVKLSVSGRGRASKVEVAQMCAHLLRLPEPPKQADAADALAIAITASQRVPIITKFA